MGTDPPGNILIADTGNKRIRVLAGSTGTFYGRAMTAGDIYSIAGDGLQGFSGDGGPASRAELDDVTGLAVDGAGDVVITDRINNRIRVLHE